jgi:transcriptional regulator with XRE-family HTH domain
MNHPHPPLPNRVALHRRKLGYSQRRVVRLLGHKSHAALSLYESGKVMPTLATALRLEAILQAPVATLFQDLFEVQRIAARSQQERFTLHVQQPQVAPILNPNHE